MEILNNHSLIHLYNEVHYNERIADTIPADGPLGPENLRRAVSTLLAASPWQGRECTSAEDIDALVAEAATRGGGHGALLESFLESEARLNGKQVWGDSSPQDVLYLARLKEWYPDAKFIGVVRDPRGFLASYKNYYRKELKTYRNRFNPLTNSFLWRSYMRALEAACHSSLADDLCLLHYEKLVSSPASEIKRVCDFLGLGFEDRMLAVGRQNSSYFSVSEDRNNQGISSGSRDRWTTELSAAEIWLVQRICGEELTRLGYTKVPVQLGAGDLGAMVRILLLLPSRLFNLLFRSGKPFTLAKIKRVWGKTQ